MVICPNCRTEVTFAIKCWTVAPVKHRATRHISEFRVGIFKCTKCKSKFRSKVKSTTKPLKTDIRDLVAKIEEIREGPTQTLRTLHEKKDAGNGAVEFVSGNRKA